MDLHVSSNARNSAFILPHPFIQLFFPPSKSSSDVNWHVKINNEFDFCLQSDDFCFRRPDVTVLVVPEGSPSRGGNVAIYVFDINQPTLPAPFHSVLVSASVFVALSTVFHSINSTDNSPLSRSVLSVLFLPCWSFQLHISL